ncbi:MAG: imidazolonepropionase [Sulfobacillus acidophilus]|uniref:Imidazolonepropionase n=1 Tax=Sulfobacillus acidophilus TaxID=53633 RepID=A0A2T2WDK3_9FIRM|nr:MAG: imidazolonepropionase [Sulfobacillus acidophilus]
MRTSIIHGRLYLDAIPSSKHLWQVEDDGAVITEDDRIVEVAPTRQVLQSGNSLGHVIDVEGRAVVPGFIDCHTHLPFAGWRSDEYVARLMGTSYESISRRKGGIARSSEQWAEASDDQIMEFTEQLAREALAWGTTVLEMKSGYGLTVAQEQRALAIIQALAARLPQPLVATGLFLHAVPPHSTDAQWLSQVKTELLPQSLHAGLISAVDAFIERTAFSPQQVLSVFTDLSGHVPIRLHTNQFSQMGGIDLAVQLRARSVEHVECLSPKEMDLLATHGIAAVVMPGAAFYRSAHAYAPARAIVDKGIRLALATDLNPGSSPVGNLPTVMALAVNLMDITPEEALAGVTREAAYVLGLEGHYGSIRPGFLGNLVVLDCPDIADIPYRIGHNPVKTVIIHGQPVL